MKRIGLVVAQQKETAMVRLMRHSACSECGACHHGESESKEIVIEALNPVEAKVGDRVEVDLESVQVVRAAFIFYTLPLIALMVGVFAGKYGLMAAGFTAHSDLGGAVIGVLLMVAAFVGIRMNEGTLRKSGRYLSQISGICGHDEEH